MLRICLLLVACGLPFARQRRDAATGIGSAIVEVAKKNRRRQSDAMLDQVAARSTGLVGPGVLAGTLLERVLQRAPAL